MVLGEFRNCLGVFARRGTCEEVLGDRRVDVHVSSATPGCILAVSSRSSIQNEARQKLGAVVLDSGRGSAGDDELLLSRGSRRGAAAEGLR